MCNSSFVTTDQKSNSLRTMTLNNYLQLPSNQNMDMTTPLPYNDTSTASEDFSSTPCHNIQSTQDARSYQRSNDMFTENALRGRQSQKLGSYNEALSYFQNALRCKRAHIHQDTIEVQIEYGHILFNIGLMNMTIYKSYALSAQAFEQCLEVRRYCLGSSHIDVSATMYCLAKVHLSAGDETYYAFTLLNESLSILLTDYPDNIIRIVTVWEELARAQLAIGDIDDAESSLREIRKLKVRAAPFM